MTDTKPGTPGIQASCKVAEIVGPSYKQVPACKAASGACNPCPCWRVTPDTKCSALSGYRLEVARNAPAVSGTRVEATCLGPK